jgi:hypothetical protein
MLLPRCEYAFSHALMFLPSRSVIVLSYLYVSNYQKKETLNLLATPVPKKSGQGHHQLVRPRGQQTRPNIINWHPFNWPPAKNPSASAYRQPTESSTCGCAFDQNY